MKNCGSPKQISLKSRRSKNRQLNHKVTISNLDFAIVTALFYFSGYSKQTTLQQQYAQHQQQLIQQQMLAQQQHYQQMKTQQYSQLVQARSQEMLSPRADEQIYYQSGYTGSPQRSGGRFLPVTSRDNNLTLQQLQVKTFVLIAVSYF